MSVEFRMLGRLEVARDGESVDLGAYRQRALLGLLLVHAGNVLSTDRILDELWGEAGGLDKQSSLWVYVSGLRGALEPNRAKRSEGTILLTRPPGYLLAIDAGSTDAGRFERTVEEARRVAETDPAEASMMLRGALATWRGHAYEEFAYESWAQAEIARLEELRVEAVENRVDADLQVGLSRELISELHSLVRQHPLRERPVTSLMVALYRSGRAAEALRVCADYRRRLVAEFGVEPSRSVHDLEHRILSDDRELLHDVTSAGEAARSRSGLTVRGYELRDELGRGAFGVVYRAYQPIVGREVAIKVIRPELADMPSFIRRFEAEAQLVARLEHPHIVPLYDFWREPGAAFLVMRLVSGGTLTGQLERGALPPERAANVFTQLAGALHSAHRSGVIHRDVKPDNVLIDSDGNAYLTDFGVALLPDEQHVGASGDGSTAMPYASPEQVSGQTMSPTSDVYSLAVVAATALSGIRGEYEQVRGALAPAVRTVLDRATAGEPSRRYATALAFAAALTEALGSSAAAIADDTGVENPYKGLRSFAAADADEFFGRERLIERLLSRLGEPSLRNRFVAVVGPSGSGKSSVVRAGLLPALARGALPMSAEWFRIEMTPAPHPFEQLETALGRVATDASSSLLDLLLTPGGLGRAVQRVLPEDNSQLVLVIDQFEELFTQVDEDTANHFIDELVALVTSPGSRARVVITLRADFYDRPLAHRGLGELLREGTEVITPLAIDELEAAIVGPAAKVGVEIEALVVAEMIGEIADRPGALPLLQYTLTELFETRDGRAITIAAYRAGGGVSRTLARRADSLLAGLGAELADTARHVFLRLVTIDDDGSGTETRRRALVAEVMELDEPGRVQRVLDTFGRHRLVSFDRDPVTRGPTVEISHEALLAEWSRLHAWIDDARDDLRAHRRLVEEMSAWTGADRSTDYLLRGSRLDTSVAWAYSTSLPLRPAEREFLEESEAARAAEEMTRQEEEQRTEQAERQARRRSRQLALAGLVTVLVAVLASVIWVQREDARDSEADFAARQEAQRLANVSSTTLERDPDLSLLLAMEAIRATADRGFAVPEAIDATHWAIQELGVPYDVPDDMPTAARFGPNGVQGVWMMPVEDLMRFAEANTDRELTAAECTLYLRHECAPAASAAGIGYEDGTAAYANAVDVEQGEVVVAISADLEEQSQEWARNMEVIGERYGIDIRIQQIPTNVSVADSVEQGIHADVYHLIAPGDLRVLADVHPVQDLRHYLDEETLLADYGRYLVSLTRIGPNGEWPSDEGAIHGVIDGADSKAIVWTKEPEFTDGGYAAPTNWASLMSLAGTMVDDGRSPFCLELMSEGADGWPATDWIEMVVLRTAGPDFYDDWVRHAVPFDSPRVVDAIRTVGTLIHSDEFLDVSPSATTLRQFGDALQALSEENACLMTPFPSFLPAILGASRSLPVGSFGFPSFGAGYDDAVVGGGGMMVAVTDRPEVRAFMKAVASPDWGVGAAQLDWPLLMPANARFDVAGFTNPETAEIVSAVQAAVRADDFRFDASDSMPPEIAAMFLDAMVRLFRDGSLDNLDELSLDIAGDIEAAWVELDAGSD